MEAPALVLGLASAILIELLKLFPDLSKSDSSKRLLAFVVVFISSLAYSAATQNYNVADISSLFIVAATISFMSYKVILQPSIELASVVGSRLIAEAKRIAPK